MRLQLVHQTEYRYDGFCSESHNELRLQPVSNAFQQLEQFDVRVTPSVAVFSHEEVGGVVHHFDVRTPHSRLLIEARATVQTFDRNPFESVNLASDDSPFYANVAVRSAYAEFLQPTRYAPFLPEVIALGTRFLSNSGEGKDLSVAKRLLNLNTYLNELLTYDTDATHVQSTLPEVLHKRAGVCQDFAHLMLSACRSNGIPARYVSGYLFVGRDRSLRGEQATHAWVECLMPNHAWIGFDPTNRLMANANYIKVHDGMDYRDVSPTKGVYVGPATESLNISVHIREMGVPVGTA
jgi:transglutaminase-like putative cysteine protease